MYAYKDVIGQMARLVIALHQKDIGNLYTGGIFCLLGASPRDMAAAPCSS